jgi:signal transduction histidine kinase
LNSKGDVQEFQYVGRDITEIKKLQTKQQELVTIEERQRLARDLHDAISQTLFSARLTSEMLLQNREDLSTDELWSNIHQFTRLITSALGEMRVLLLELRPENLARTDATSILKNLADAMGSRTTADINLAVTEKGEMPTNVKIAFYRITQEALNNAIKHSRCKNISIKLTAKENESQLIIEDDGEGGAILKQNEGMSMGLNIMEERAREINAVLKIISPLKKGTKISCVWRKQ